MLMALITSIAIGIGTIVPCSLIPKGIFVAATQGNASFALRVEVTWETENGPKTVSATTNLDEVELEADLGHTVEVEMEIPVEGEMPARGTVVTAVSTLVVRTPQGDTDISQPVSVQLILK